MSKLVTKHKKTRNLGLAVDSDSDSERLARDQSKTLGSSLFFESVRVGSGSGGIRLRLDFAQREAGLQLVADVSVFGGFCNDSVQRLSSVVESAGSCLNVGICDAKQEALLLPPTLAKQRASSRDCPSGCCGVPLV